MSRPGAHDWSFLVSWAPTRVLRSTSSCIPRPRTRSLCVSICFSGEPSGARARSAGSLPGDAEGVVRGGRTVRDLSLQRRLSEPVIARTRSARRLCGASSDAPRPAPGRDTLRQRRPGVGADLLAVVPLDTLTLKSKRRPRWVRARMREHICCSSNPTGAHETKSELIVSPGAGRGASEGLRGRRLDDVVRASEAPPSIEQAEGHRGGGVLVG